MCEAIFAILHSWPVWFGVSPWKAPSHRWGSFMSDIISTIVDLGTSDDEDGHKWSRFIMIRDTLLCCYIILPPLNYNSVFFVMTSPLWWYSTLGNVQCRLRSQTMKPEIEADVSHGGGNLSPSIQLPICKNTNTLIYEYIHKYTK